jgi:glyoxylase-like metal-dependent hydrolase (beta-lactamase superfamily II)
MSDLIALSTQIIDEGAPIFPVRINNELSEIADGVMLVESFSNVVAIATEEGLLLSDTSGAATGAAVVKSLRAWSDAAFHTILYTHGHIDHVGGAGAFAANAAALGHRAPRFVGHENLPARFERYDLTAGYNTVINRRQFGESRRMSIGGDQRFLPKGTPAPDLTFRDRMELPVGGVQMELRHAKGETDDHAWAWLPERKMILTGDFFIWNFPTPEIPRRSSVSRANGPPPCARCRVWERSFWSPPTVFPSRGPIAFAWCSTTPRARSRPWCTGPWR